MRLIRRLWRRLRRIGPTHHVRESGGAHGTVRVREYDVAACRERWDDWAELDTAERGRRVRNSNLAPTDDTTTSNAIVDEYWQHIVDLMDQTQSVSAEDITHFAVGTDGTAASTADSSLGNEVLRDQIDTEDDQGKDLAIQATLDTNQANGNTLVETALFTGTSGGSTIMVNRAITSSTDKTNQKIMTLDYTLKYRDGG